MTEVPSTHVVKIKKVALFLKLSAVLLLSQPFGDSFAFNCFNNYSRGLPETLSLSKKNFTSYSSGAPNENIFQTHLN